jgi:eukaryotic-like serine/threonine-protein kinase
MERDLILATLAVQIGFATPAQVMAAAAAFIADKSHSIAQRLENEGHLDSVKRGMLEGMVDEAVKVHGGDIKRTMQSMGGKEAVYASFGGDMVVDEQGNLSVIAVTDSKNDSLDETSHVFPETPGRYKIGDEPEIGRGGIGRVFVAFDTSLGREIAVKELLPDHFQGMSTPNNAERSRTGALAARFLREARVTGQLEHPNIMPVYEVGQRNNGVYYYTMKLVRGRTLATALKKTTTLSQRLGLLHHFVDLCNAVAYAHSRDVVHRDIKPENVMVGEFGETVVLDWGLAKLKGKKDIRQGAIKRDMELMHESGTGKTVHGAAIGTPAYMSPEQAEGAIDSIDEKSDIWSLGAVLYEILTGAPPFTGESAYEIIGKVIKDPVVKPDVKDENIPPELSAVVLKALSRAKSERYKKAEMLAKEIGAYMSGGRITAYEYSSIELLRGFVAKNKVASALVVFIAVLLTAGAMTLFAAYSKAGRERTKAQIAATLAQKNHGIAVKEQAKARDRETEAQFNLSAAFESKALSMIKNKQHSGAEVYAAASMLHNPVNKWSPHFDSSFKKRSRGGAQLLTSAGSILFQARHKRFANPQKVLRTKYDLRTLELSPDGKYLATMSFEHNLLLWDIEKRVLLYKLKKIFSMVFSPKGDKIIAVTEDGHVQIRALHTGQIELTVNKITKPYRKAFIAPGGKELVTMDRDAIRYHSLTEHGPPSFIVPTNGYRGWRSGMERYEAGQKVLMFSYGKPQRIFDVQKKAFGLTLQSSKNTDNAIYGSAFSKDGRYIALGGLDWNVRVWDLVKNTLLYTLRGHKEGVVTVIFSPDGRFLASGASDRTVRIWDTQTGALVDVLANHKDPVRGVLFSPDGTKLYTSSSDGNVIIWSLDIKGKATVLPHNSLRIWRAIFSPDGNFIATSSSIGAHVWDVRTGKENQSLSVKMREVMASAFSPDGKLFATVNAGGELKFLDQATGKIRHSKSMKKGVSGVVFSPDSKQVAITSKGKLILLDAKSLAVVATFPRNTSHGESHYSPDGRLIATSHSSKRIVIYDVKSKRLLKTLKGHKIDTFNVRFSHNGKILATMDRSGGVFLWDTSTWKILRELHGHKRWVNSASFSPDDTLIATGSDEQTARIWNVATGKNVQTFILSAEGFGVDFSPDGKTLAVIDGKNVLLYPLNFALFSKNPKVLLKKAETSNNLKLEGFSLKIPN